MRLRFKWRGILKVFHGAHKFIFVLPVWQGGRL
jgi:hypothetical protein